MKTDEIRLGLRNIKTRSGTIDAVVEAGDAVIADVLPLLQDRNEGVRWSAIRILSEVGDARAIGPLVVLLEQGKNATEAVNALRTITGQDFGEDSGGWRQWAMQEPELRNAASLGLLSNEDLMAAATKGLPVTVTGGGQAFAVTVTLPEGRSQQVWIDFSSTDTSGQPIVQLSTPCGDADPEQYEPVLKLNMQLSYGAIALAVLDDALCFAVVDTYLRQTVHPEDIAKSILSLARHGDSIEVSLSRGEDRF